MKSYTQATYGRKHRQAYLNRRCHELAKIIAECSAKTSPLDVLEIGCGTGVNINQLAGHNLLKWGVHFTGIEKRKDRLSEARKNAKKENVEFLYGEVTFDTGDGQSYFSAGKASDFVFSTRFLHLFSDAEKTMVIKRCISNKRMATVHEWYSPFGRPLRYLASLLFPNLPSSKRFKRQRPAMRQVREIHREAGAGIESVIPLRFTGEGLLYWVMKKVGLVPERVIYNWLKKTKPNTPFWFFVDEYFITSKIMKFNIPLQKSPTDSCE